MCAKLCTVGPQQYIPAFPPAGSSGTNSSADLVNVLKSLKAMLANVRRYTIGASLKEK